jgi:drug/metabolite transporter (DMT)-like permease
LDAGNAVAAVSARDWTNLKAALYVLTAIGIFALIFTSGRFTGDQASALQIMFLRYAGGFLTVLLIAAFRRESWAGMQSRHRFNQAARALSGGLGGAAIIFGNANMPLVDANAISLLKVVFLVALGMLILGDRLRTRHVVGILVCLAGAAVVVASRGAFTNMRPGYLLPALVTLVGALLFAIEALYIKILTTADRPLVTLAHANLFGMLLLLVPALLTWQSTGPINLILLMLGPLAILAQYFNIRGYTLASVSIIAPLTYASLIFAALFGWLFFAELPTPGILAGAALIAVGGTILALSRR